MDGRTDLVASSVFSCSYLGYGLMAGRAAVLAQPAAKAKACVTARDGINYTYGCVCGYPSADPPHADARTRSRTYHLSTEGFRARGSFGGVFRGRGSWRSCGAGAAVPCCAMLCAARGPLRSVQSTQKAASRSITLQSLANPSPIDRRSGKPYLVKSNSMAKTSAGCGHALFFPVRSGLSSASVRRRRCSP